MNATRETIIAELEQIGITESQIPSEYWIDYIADYRNRGKCGSVMASTLEFIPLISKLLELAANKEVK